MKFLSSNMRFRSTFSDCETRKRYYNIKGVILRQKSSMKIRGSAICLRYEEGESCMKISYNYTKTGVLGDFPLTRRHCNTKCVSCDGPEEPLHIYIEMHCKRRGTSYLSISRLNMVFISQFNIWQQAYKKETVGFCVPFSIRLYEYTEISKPLIWSLATISVCLILKDFRSLAMLLPMLISFT